MTRGLIRRLALAGLVAIWVALSWAASRASAEDAARIAWADTMRVVAIGVPGETLTETVAAVEVRPGWIEAQCSAGIATLTVRVGPLASRSHAVGPALLRVLPPQVVASQIAVALSVCRDPTNGALGVGTLVIDARVRN